MKPKRTDPKKGRDEKDAHKRVITGLIVATVVVIAGIVALIVGSSRMLLQGTRTGIFDSIIALIKQPFEGHKVQSKFEASLPQDEMQHRINEALKKYKAQGDPKNPFNLKDDTVIANILKKGMPGKDDWDSYMGEVDRAALLVINSDGSIARVQAYIRDAVTSSPETMLAGLDTQYKVLDTRYQGLKSSYLQGQQGYEQMAQAMSSLYDKSPDTVKQYYNKQIDVVKSKLQPDQASKFQTTMDQKLPKIYQQFDSDIASVRMSKEAIYKKLTTSSDMATRFQGFTFGMIDLRAQMFYNRAKADSISALIIR